MVRNFGQRSGLAVGAWQYTTDWDFWRGKTTSDGKHTLADQRRQWEKRKVVKKKKKAKTDSSKTIGRIKIENMTFLDL